MKLVSKFLNYEIGFFIKKRFDFLDLFNGAKCDNPSDVIVTSQKEKWQLEFNIEKRIQAITGYNFKNKNLDESGTCLLKWLFRDVHTNVLINYKYFDAVMDVPLNNTEDWRKTLIKNHANSNQIDLYNSCCAKKLKFVMQTISSEDYDLFVHIMQHYKDDNEFNVLVNSIRYLD